MLKKMSQENQENELLLKPTKSHIPHLPESVIKDNCYEVEIKNIYDPSKFWLILHFRELDIFMKYLKDFYGNEIKRKSIPRIDLKRELMCIVNRYGLYYRAIILPILLPDNEKVRVIMIDFGLIANVNINEVFYIFKKHSVVPRFAVRASLANLCPFDSSKPWNSSDLRTFLELLSGKRLFAKVCEVDTDRKILLVELRRICGKKMESVNYILLRDKIATYSKYCDTTKAENLTNIKAKVKYLHLFPSFEALEKGIVPCSLWEDGLLKDTVALDVLYKGYYKYQESDGK